MKLELTKLPSPHHEHKTGCRSTHARSIKTQAYLQIVQWNAFKQSFFLLPYNYFINIQHWSTSIQLHYNIENQLEPYNSVTSLKFFIYWYIILCISSTVKYQSLQWAHYKNQYKTSGKWGWHIHVLCAITHASYIYCRRCTQWWYSIQFLLLECEHSRLLTYQKVMYFSHYGIMFLLSQRWWKGWNEILHICSHLVNQLDEKLLNFVEGCNVHTLYLQYKKYILINYLS